MITLWEHNSEFEIIIENNYTMTWPILKIRKDGNPVLTTSLRNKSFIDVINELYIQFPESDFLKKLIKNKSV